MENASLVQDFVLSYLREIRAEVQEADGVYHAAFPLGWKRRFGRERRFTFDPTRLQPHVELVEPGSPFLKLLLADAERWGGVGLVGTGQLPEGAVVFTFQFEAFSSVRKRTAFAHALIPPTGEPRIVAGIPLLRDVQPPRTHERVDAERLKGLLPPVLGPLEQMAREFAHETLRESQDGFEKAIVRVRQYYEGMKQETFLEEARIRKRLGKIQSKLYFTEDGLRELKLQREQEKLTKELYTLKQRKTHSEDTLVKDESDHVEKQRRRHEPKLRIRLIGVTLVRAPGSAPEPPPPPPEETEPPAPEASAPAGPGPNPSD